MKTPLCILLVAIMPIFLIAQDDPFATQKQSREDLLKLRETQKGKQFEKLTLGDKTFTAAKIMEITDLGVKISHSSGIGVINWGLIQPEARTALGFDPIAFAEFDAAQKEKDRKQKEYFNSPEYQAEKAALAEKSRMVKEELGDRTKQAEIARLEAKINEGNIALKSLQDARKQLDDFYKAEDKKARSNKSKGVMGGIKTSDADRGKKVAEWAEKIRYTEIQISRLSQELAQLQASE